MLLIHPFGTSESAQGAVAAGFEDGVINQAGRQSFSGVWFRPPYAGDLGGDAVAIEIPEDVANRYRDPRYSDQFFLPALLANRFERSILTRDALGGIQRVQGSPKPRPTGWFLWDVLGGLAMVLWMLFRYVLFIAALGMILGGFGSFLQGAGIVWLAVGALGSTLLWAIMKYGDV